MGASGLVGGELPQDQLVGLVKLYTVHTSSMNYTTVVLGDSVGYVLPSVLLLIGHLVMTACFI